MKLHVTLDTALKVTEMVVSPIACWPLSPDDSFSTVLKHNIIWWLTICHMIFCLCTFIPEIFRATSTFDHIILVTADTVATAMIASKMLICKLQENRLRGLINEMRKFMKAANQEELDLIQSYIDKCIYPHLVILVSTSFGSLVFIMAPAFSEQQLILESPYPYSMEQTWIWALTYLSQSIFVCQVGCSACLDFMFVILLWYAGARIEILGIKIERTKNSEGVMHCIREHQELLEYIDRLKIPARIIALEVTAIAVFAVCVGGIVLMRQPAMIVIAKYFIFELVAGMELFLYTWPADNIIEMSVKISNSAFNSEWVENSSKMTKYLLFIMQRAQSPIVIDVPGLLPALTLGFYATVMKLTFSYMTTIYTAFGE